MKESRTIEWKETWRDAYLRWICGFANAESGVLVISRDDDGQPMGVKDRKKLLEDLLNTIRDVLGIVADVRLVTRQMGCADSGSAPPIVGAAAAVPGTQPRIVEASRATARRMTHLIPIAQG